MPPFRLTEPVVFTFVLIPLLLAIAFVWAAIVATRRSGSSRMAAIRTGLMAGAGAVVWMTLTWVAANSGILQNWEAAPPPFALLILGVIAISLMLPFSAVGTRIAQHTPLWALVGIQAFRLPLEVAMHALVARGIMPEQMSYSGRNFDIVTGATAIVVAALAKAGYGGRPLVAMWNVVGLVLLINVMTVAIMSTPQIRLFGDDRVVTFVTYTPFVWLPAVMVLAALAGHILIFRALNHRPGRRR
jgi:hypothetical protein